ncbi:phage major capsid protein [Anaerotruncus rubiinfantis]|jgi:HK97 family phage major capsid protein|uniref:phage major capsid protein n=1 Tax=Anaerotruncus rubiinfantis TaxID=1720200 RepID=UPI0009AD3F23|nr:phage major capsid protein [Anaerotruncus rubiinfantis]
MINLKALMEKRAEQQQIMENLLHTADTETRAMSEEEAAQFDAAEKEIRAIDETIAREERARKVEKKAVPSEAEERAADEERAFADYVMGKVPELRAGEQNMDMGNNGAIIPTSIANRIIKEVKDRCPILAKATIYNVKGTLKVPVWGKADSTHDITVGYQTEFTEITADSGAFTSVDLSGYLAGALTLIGRSVENNGTFSVVNFIVSQMAEEIALFLERELLIGTSSKATGALSTTTTLTAASAAAITADELIDLQAKVKQVYQGNACWIMNPSTFTAIKKLKDGNNRYLLQDDVTGEFPYRLLGKPVYLSDNMPAIAASAKAILYGDCSGLSVNMRENISIEVLREKYATQHAIGVVAWFEFDSKVTDNQKLAALVMKAS